MINVLTDAAMSDERWRALASTVNAAELRSLIPVLEGQRQRCCARIEFVHLLLALDGSSQ